MHRLIAGFAAALRTHSLPAARTAAGRLEALAGQRAAGEAGGFVPRHLDTALAAAGAHPLAALFAEIAHRVPWVEVSGRDMPAGFRGRYSYCDIAGPEGAIHAPDICFGAYLQFPDTWYPPHWHAAEELYLPLSGTALWTRDGVRDAAAPPGALIRHAPFERHATRTGAEPLLALWAWIGDLDFGTYEIEEA